MKIYFAMTATLLMLVLTLIFRQESDKAALRAQIRASDRAAADEIAKFRDEFFARMAAEKAEREKREAEQKAGLAAAIRQDLKALPSGDFHKTVDFPTPAK